MRIWEMINAGDTEGLAARMRQLNDDLTARIKTTHTKMDHCTNWETWTEEDVPCETEEGVQRLTVTFDGCRKHHVKMMRDQ